jgi:hypothetical protein
MLLRRLSLASVPAVAASCALLLWVIIGSSAHAESPERAAKVDLFLDLDADGGMSYEEFVQSLATKSMNALDSDHDGFLSEEEVKSQSSTAQSSILLRSSEGDVDGDKRLSAKELESATRKSSRVRVLYGALDVDHNDRVSRSEWRNASTGVGLLRIEF